MRRLEPSEFQRRIAHIHGDSLLVTGKYQNTRTKVPASCTRCGHTWEVVPASLLKGIGCPECGKIKAKNTPKHPQAAARFSARWVKSSVEILTPYQGALKPIRVRCRQCDSKWTTTPYRLQRHGCTPCGHLNKGLKLRKAAAKFQQQVNQIHGGQIRLVGAYLTGKHRISVLCTQCGHQWKPVAGRLVRGFSAPNSSARGCPRCCSSKGEKAIAKILVEHGIPFIQEYTFPDLKSPDGGRLRFDFAVWDDRGRMSHLIEYDGVHHFRPLKHLGGEKRFWKQQRNDALKNKYCLERGIPLIRFSQPRLNLITMEMLQCPPLNK